MCTILLTKNKILSRDKILVSTNVLDHGARMNDKNDAKLRNESYVLPRTCYLHTQRQTRMSLLLWS